MSVEVVMIIKNHQFRVPFGDPRIIYIFSFNRFSINIIRRTELVLWKNAF